MKDTFALEMFQDYMKKIPVVDDCVMTGNDGVIVLKNGKKWAVSIMVAEFGYPKEILQIIAEKKKDRYNVVIAPYITEATARICRDGGVGYLDMAGNCTLAHDSIYIDVKGNKNDNVRKRGLKSIYERSSVVSSRILRTLFSDVQKPWKLKALAAEVGCSIGQMSKVKEFLLNQSYVEDTREGIRVTDPEGILRSWAEVYGRGNEECYSYYSLYDVAALEAKIACMNKELGLNCVLTCFSGGTRYQPVVRYQKVHAYIDSADLAKAVEYLGLKRVETGANVVLMIPYDSCVLHDACLVRDNLVVSPVQLYLDCMALKGRGEEQAEALLKREICR